MKNYLGAYKYLIEGFRIVGGQQCVVILDEPFQVPRNRRAPSRKISATVVFVTAVSAFGLSEMAEQGWLDGPG